MENNSHSINACNYVRHTFLAIPSNSTSAPIFFSHLCVHKQTPIKPIKLFASSYGQHNVWSWSCSVDIWPKIIFMNSLSHSLYSHCMSGWVLYTYSISRQSWIIAGVIDSDYTGAWLLVYMFRAICQLVQFINCTAQFVNSQFMQYFINCTIIYKLRKALCQLRCGWPSYRPYTYLSQLKQSSLCDIVIIKTILIEMARV